MFAKTVAKAMLETCSMKEDPMMVDELLAGFEASTEHKRSRESREIVMDSLRLKRRRCDFKQPCPAAFAPVEPPLSWETVTQEASKVTSRVGVRNFREGEFFEKVPKGSPRDEGEAGDHVSGTDRFRTPNKDEDLRDLTLRKTVYVHRVSGEVIDVGGPEEWKKLSRMKRIGKCGPARLSLTLFGMPWLPLEQDKEEETKGISCVGAPPNVLSIPNPPDQEWAPRPIAVSGPAFLSLTPEETRDIQRLHQNLGHPGPELFGKFLRERGASDAVLKGVRDFQCPTFAENQDAPLFARPSTIHRELDFNDEVGGDGAWWKNGRGKSGRRPRSPWHARRAFGGNRRL